MVTKIKCVLLLLPVVITFDVQHGWEEIEFHPVIPRTWDDTAMAELEIPLADPAGSPEHVSAAFCE